MDILTEQPVGRFAAASQQTQYCYDGETLRFEDVIAGDDPGPPMHFHPKQIERFQVLDGSMSIRLEGQQRLLAAGDSIEIAAGQVHSFHTKGSAGVRLLIELAPAGEMEAFFKGLARAKREGRYPLLQIAVMYTSAKDFGFYLAGVPVWAQKLLFSVLAPIARGFGYRA